MREQITKKLFFALMQRRYTKSCYFYLLYCPSNVINHDGRPCGGRPSCMIMYIRWTLLQIKATIFGVTSLHHCEMCCYLLMLKLLNVLTGATVHVFQSFRCSICSNFQTFRIFKYSNVQAFKV